MLAPLSSKYFEILSHPIRFAILNYIDVSSKSYSDIMEGISSDTEIKSNKLNFHLKKMLDEEVLVKNDKSYSLSELGLKLLSLVYQFENLDKKPVNLQDVEDEEDQSETKPAPQASESLIDKGFPVIRKFDGLSPLISVFEYFEGKNFEYMEENFSLELPEPISTETNPLQWIKTFTQNLSPLITDEKSKDWLVDRYLKLGYGTRGLQDYGLMDASLSVPPLDSLFESIVDLLSIRGKIGLYAKTGMGKSRISLYTASYWLRKHKTPVFYIQNPHFLPVGDFDKFQEILMTNVGKERKSPKYLIIIEDAHLTNKDQLSKLIKLIAGASNKTYSVFVSFTEIQILNENYRSELTNIEQIEELRREVIPDEYAVSLDLQKHWETLRPYFNEWIKWVAADILFDYLPNVEIKREKLNIYHSPWSFVVSLGFLKGSLAKLQNSGSVNSFPLVLYYFLAQMYIMRGEKSLALSSLKEIFHNYLKDELELSFGKEWEKQYISLLNSWTDPMSRLLPPFKYVQKDRTLLKEGFIYFYHLEWANEVCNYLDSSNKQLASNFDKFFAFSFPLVYKIWVILKDKNLSSTESYSSWLRDNLRFELSAKNEIMLTTLVLNTKQKTALKNFKLSESELSQLKQSELVNWMFIKSIINS